MAIAMRDSVTVSIAAVRTGTEMRMLRVSCEDVSTSEGTTSDSPGSSSTSSKVRPSGMAPTEPIGTVVPPTRSPVAPSCP